MRRDRSGRMILLYPSWLPRGELRFDGTDTRLTVEFDLAVPV